MTAADGQGRPVSARLTVIRALALRDGPAPPVVAAPAADVQALADAVADRIAGRPEPVLVDAATLAQRLSVSRSFVYENAEMLGAIKLGDGPRAGLRFEVSVAVEAMRSRFGSKRSPADDHPNDGADQPVRQRRASARATSVHEPRIPEGRRVRGERA